MSKKILIVEDNPQNMRLIEMSLGSENYTLLEALTGKMLGKSARKNILILS